MKKKKNNKLEKTLDQLNIVRNGLYTSMAKMIKINNSLQKLKIKQERNNNAFI